MLPSLWLNCRDLFQIYNFTLCLNVSKINKTKTESTKKKNMSFKKNEPLLENIHGEENIELKNDNRSRENSSFLNS